MRKSLRKDARIAILAALASVGIALFAWWLVSHVFAASTIERLSLYDDKRGTSFSVIVNPSSPQLGQFIFVVPGFGQYSGGAGDSITFPDPPTVVYYAGTNDSDDKIIRFFIDRATSNGWHIFREPGKLSTDVKASVIFDKNHVGSLFVRTFEPERLNRSLRGDR